MSSKLPDSNEIDGALRAELGQRVGADTLRFVRHFAASAEHVWNALTTPQGIAAWLGKPVAIESKSGGAFEVAFSAEDRMDGQIVEFEPPKRLAIAWHETSSGTSDGDTSLVTFDLASSASGGTTLVLTHSRISDAQTIIGLAGGWHTHLEALRAFVQGLAPVDRDALYSTLKPAYERHLSSAV